MPTVSTARRPRLGIERIGLVLVAALGLLAVARGAGANAPYHAVKIINRCDQQVWLGVNGSSALPAYDIALAPRCTAANAATVCTSGGCKKGSCTCTGDADCAFGAPMGTTTAKCDTGRGRCVDRTRLQVPQGWTGRIWPRTDCAGSDTSFVCESGQCGPPGGGNIDCYTQGANADLATLFELTASAYSTDDNFDVSLVSGYNLPVAVKVVLASDAPLWQPSTFYAGGAQIIERTSAGIFAYTNTGAGGTSSASKPIFARKWGHETVDAAGVTWQNTGPVCEKSGCKRSGIPEAQCPTALQQIVGGDYVACNVPSNVCDPTDADCSYYQCQNGRSGAPTDQFGNALGLVSANGASHVCYSADDCAPGSRCLIDPQFKMAGVSVPSGTGVCVPVSQDGLCTSVSDGDPCPGINFPFPGYSCQTLSGKSDGVKVCLPSTTSGLGDVWWNAANWSSQSTSCTTDAGCAAGQKCLAAEVQKGLQECPPGDMSCTCYAAQTCTSTTDCQGTGQCLDSTGKEAGNGADCASSPYCYCSPQGIYSGACGATNQAWIDAAANISEAGASWPQGFRASCPVAYGYQFDDPASNWFCPNGSTGLNGYKVVLCGSVGR